MIFYHYMKCNPYFAEQHPEWVQRTANGSAMGWSRCPAGGLSTCVPAWRKTYIEQILELVEMGKDVGQDGTVFYFDEFPSSPTGDWNPSCKSEFAKRFGYTMPDEPTSDVLAFNQAVTQEYYDELVTAIANATSTAAALVSITFAPSLDNRGWVNYTNTVEVGYSPQAVAKVEFSKGLVAKPVSSKSQSNANASCSAGWSPPVSGRSPGSTLGEANASSYGECQEQCCAEAGCLGVIYYTQNTPNNNCHLLDRTYNKELQCLAGGSSPLVANRHGGGVSPSVCPKAGSPVVPGAPIDDDILLSWAWALGRGASDGQPPHTWIPWLYTAEQASCAASALRAYGHIANPDHTETDIPNVSLYGELYKTAAVLDKASADSTSTPLRFAAVVFSERARNALYASPDHPRGTASADALSLAWKNLLYPAAGMWQALVRSGAPAAIIPEWLLERKAAQGQPSEFPVLLAPAYLDNKTEAVLTQLEEAGTTVIRAAPGDDWEDAESRKRLGGEMLSKAIATAGDPRVAFTTETSGTQPRHVVAYELRRTGTDPETKPAPLMIHVLNDFSWCAPERSVKVPPPSPPPVSGLRIAVRADTEAHGSVVDYSAATARNVLTGKAVQVLTNGTGLELMLPSFKQFLVLRIDF